MKPAPGRRRWLLEALLLLFVPPPLEGAGAWGGDDVTVGLGAATGGAGVTCPAAVVAAAAAAGGGAGPGAVGSSPGSLSPSGPRKPGAEPPPRPEEAPAAPRLWPVGPERDSGLGAAAFSPSLRGSGPSRAGSRLWAGRALTMRWGAGGRVGGAARCLPGGPLPHAAPAHGGAVGAEASAAPSPPGCAREAACPPSAAPADGSVPAPRPGAVRCAPGTPRAWPTRSQSTPQGLLLRQRVTEGPGFQRLAVQVCRSCWALCGVREPPSPRGASFMQGVHSNLVSPEMETALERGVVLERGTGDESVLFLTVPGMGFSQKETRQRALRKTEELFLSLSTQSMLNRGSSRKGKWTGVFWWVKQMGTGPSRLVCIAESLSSAMYCTDTRESVLPLLEGHPYHLSASHHFCYTNTRVPQWNDIWTRMQVRGEDRSSWVWLG